MKPYHAPPAHEIVPRLWLGNAKASMDADWLRQTGVTVVMNCTKDRPFSHTVPIQYRVPVDDNLQEAEIRNMELWSTEIAYQLLKEYQQGHTILVHCAAGIQRSAAAVAFFLIAHQQQTAHEAMRFIQERRPVAFRPGANFERAILSFASRFHAVLLPEILQRIASQEPHETTL
jgi:hypothetical protein